MERFLCRFALERGPISVVVNLVGDSQRVTIRSGAHQPLQSSAAKAGFATGAMILPPDSVAIIRQAR